MALERIFASLNLELEYSFVESTRFLVPIGTEVRRLRQILPQNAEHGGEELHAYLHFFPTRSGLQASSPNSI